MDTQQLLKAPRRYFCFAVYTVCMALWGSAWDVSKTLSVAYARVALHTSSASGL